MPAHNDTRGWITRTRRSTEAALDGDLWRSLRPLTVAVCTKLLIRMRPTEAALHRQRSYGAVSQKNVKLRQKTRNQDSALIFVCFAIRRNAPAPKFELSLIQSPRWLSSAGGL